MHADADIQVWLETGAHAAASPPGLIIPYVKSAEAGVLRYRLRTVREGRQGKAVLVQTGVVDVRADVATPLLRMTVTRENEDLCRIELVLSDQHNPDRTYQFDCPKSESGL